MTAGPVIGVVGSGRPHGRGYETAREVGLYLARAGAVVICGGLSGVMEGVAKGVEEGRGLSIGILPGADSAEANKYLTVALPTGMGNARNAIIARAAQGLIAIQGGLGTLSEMALGLKMGKPVVALDCPHDLPGVVKTDNPAQAVETILSRVEPA